MALTSSEQMRASAGVIGWISTTDVLLLFVVFLFASALIIQGALNTNRHQLTESEDNRMEAETHVTDLQAKVADRNAELEKKDAELAAAKAALSQAERDLRLARDAITRLQGQLADRNAEIEKKDADLAAAKAALSQAERDLRLARDTVTRLERQLAAAVAEKQQRVSGKILGMPGRFGRVAIVFDRSGSMKEDPMRWDQARGIASTWIGNLDMDECAIVVFSNIVNKIPDAQKTGRHYYAMRGHEGEVNRKLLSDWIWTIKCEGTTDTAGALQAAYDCPDLDTIILFTDGRPTGPKLGDFDLEEVEKVYALCRQHKNIPVHVVGLGDYYTDKEFGKFLMEVAQITGGTFLGR